MNPRGTYRKALVETTAATAKKTRVPDAAQRLFGGAPQSRDPFRWTPDQQCITPQARRAALHPGNAGVAKSLLRVTCDCGWDRRLMLTHGLLNRRP
jgi:hypothetical protein